MGIAASRSESAEGSLLYGARDGDLRRVRRAIESSSPISQEELNHAAWTASNGNHLEVVQYLLESGASTASIASAVCRVRNVDML